MGHVQQTQLAIGELLELDRGWVGPGLWHFQRQKIGLIYVYMYMSSAPQKDRNFFLHMWFIYVIYVIYIYIYDIYIYDIYIYIYMYAAFF